MLSVRGARSPHSHLLRGWGFDLELESSQEISGYERTRWPVEVWQGLHASSLALPNTGLQMLENHERL